MGFKYLNNAGYGIMTYRFNNLMIYKELGVLGIIPAILQNPAYYLSTFWTTEKIAYLLVVLGSLGFLPLFQRKGAHYFLIIPLVVMNLSSNYTYSMICVNTITGCRAPRFHGDGRGKLY